MNQFLKILLLLVFLGAAKSGLAQKQGRDLIDSLLHELPKQKEDTNKAILLNKLCFSYCRFSTDTGIQYGQTALALAIKIGWDKGVARAENNIANNYFVNRTDPIYFAKAMQHYQAALKKDEEIGYRSGIGSTGMVATAIGKLYISQSDYPRALEYCFKALKAYEETGDNHGVASTCQLLGNIYCDKSDYPNALNYYFRALKIGEETGNKTDISNSLGNIGTVYLCLKDYPKSLEYFLKTLQAIEKSDDRYSVAVCLCNIGLVYEAENKNTEALTYYNKALKEDENIGDKEGIARVTGNIANVYNTDKDYAAAIENYLKALKIAEEIGKKMNAAIINCDIGNCFLAIIKDTGTRQGTREGAVKKYIPNGTIPAGKIALLGKAIDYLQKGLTIAKTTNTPGVMQECYQNLAEAYKLKGDYKKSLEATDNYHAIKDSIFSKENDEKIVKLGVKNEYDRQRLADSVNTAAKEKITTEKLQRQKGYTVMGIASILLLAGFSFFIVKERGKSETERKKSDALLLNILPEEVASELKVNGTTKARHFENVTVLFTDFVNFTEAGERMKPQALIDELHACFKAFDEITDKYNIEKIKTIGDAYLAVAGLPSADSKHAENAVKAAIEINTFIADRHAKLGNSTFSIRIGIHSGSVVAGIVGVKKFAYDIWGDAVNTAARMEQNSEAGKINISQATYELVKDKFTCEYRGEIDAKNKGELKMYFVG